MKSKTILTLALLSLLSTPALAQAQDEPDDVPALPAERHAARIGHDLDVEVPRIRAVGAPSPAPAAPADVSAAIQRTGTPDGVLVLMDLGSAVLSAELALDLIDDEIDDADRGEHALALGGLHFS